MQGLCRFVALLELQRVFAAVDILELEEIAALSVAGGDAIYVELQKMTRSQLRLYLYLNLKITGVIANGFLMLW